MNPICFLVREIIPIIPSQSSVVTLLVLKLARDLVETDICFRFVSRLTTNQHPYQRPKKFRCQGLTLVSLHQDPVGTFPRLVTQTEEVPGYTAHPLYV